MSAKIRIRIATEQIARDLLSQCTVLQQERFKSMWHVPYPDKDPVLSMTDTQLYDSINLLERTLTHSANPKEPK